MRLSLNDAVDTGAVKPLRELKLSHENKKSVKEGIIFDSFAEDKDMFAVVMLAKINIEETAKREIEASYVYSPTQRKFSSFVRITALVLKAAKLFKLNLISSQERNRRNAGLVVILCQFQLKDSHYFLNLVALCYLSSI